MRHRMDEKVQGNLQQINKQNLEYPNECQNKTKIHAHTSNARIGLNRFIQISNIQDNLTPHTLKIPLTLENLTLETSIILHYLESCKQR